MLPTFTQCHPKLNISAILLAQHAGPCLIHHALISAAIVTNMHAADDSMMVAARRAGMAHAHMHSCTAFQVLRVSNCCVLRYRT